jgi:hypothetical protein
MTMSALLALAAALAAGGTPPAPAAAATPAPAAAAPPAAEAPRDWDQPPPGTKADQELWRSAREANVELGVEQHRAARLTQGAKGSGYLERLPELATRGALPKAKADELAQRLLQKWMADLEVVQRPWPVGKIRVCGYELLNFETVMIAPPGSDPLQASSRSSLEECVSRARLVLGHLRRANDELEAALDEVGRELASLPAAAPAAAPTGTAVAPPAAAPPGAPAPVRAD